MLDLNKIKKKLPKFSIGAGWMGLGGFGVAKTGPAIGGKSAEIKYLFIYFLNIYQNNQLKCIHFNFC